VIPSPENPKLHVQIASELLTEHAAKFEQGLGVHGSGGGTPMME